MSPELWGHLVPARYFLRGDIRPPAPPPVTGLPRGLVTSSSSSWSLPVLGDSTESSHSELGGFRKMFLSHQDEIKFLSIGAFQIVV